MQHRWAVKCLRQPISRKGLMLKHIYPSSAS
jgi:hypothetical protein